ncbi:hypothetical protein C0J52_00043 [Blattella germanica]|nr:hypothetical protein C0J52_00043 [Blattella germanica]
MNSPSPSSWEGPIAECKHWPREADGVVKDCGAAVLSDGVKVSKSDHPLSVSSTYRLHPH